MAACGRRARPVPPRPARPAAETVQAAAETALPERPRPRSVEDDDLAQPVARAKAVEGGLQVVEPDPPIDEAIDRQAPVEVQLGVAREVDRRVGEAVVRTRGSGGCRPRTGRPRTTPGSRTGSCRRARPSRRWAVPRSPVPPWARARWPRTRSRGRRRSGRAAPRWWRPGRRRRAARRWPRTRAPRRSLAATRSMATIATRLRERRAPITHDRPTPTEPDDRHAGPRRDGRGLEHGPDAGRHATADECRHAGIHAVGQWHGGRDGHDRGFGHRPDRRSRRGPARRPAPASTVAPSAIRCPNDGESTDRPTAGRRGRPGTCRTARATTTRRPGRHATSSRRAPRLRRRRRPRDPSRSAQVAATRRRGRAGRNGRRPRRSSAPGPRRRAVRPT